MKEYSFQYYVGTRCIEDVERISADKVRELYDKHIDSFMYSHKSKFAPTLAIFECATGNAYEKLVLFLDEDSIVINGQVLYVKSASNLVKELNKQS